MYIEDTDEEKKVANSEGQSVGAGGSSEGNQGGTALGAGSDSVAPAQPSQEKAQTFGTVQDYLKSNTAQGDALGTKFNDSLNTTLGNEKSAIDNSANLFGSEVDAGTVKADTGLINDAATAPTKVANDPNNLTSWLKQYNASYAGPSSFEGSDVFAPASKAASEASTNAELVKDTGGREQLLQDQFGVYGQGNRGLDQALLQNSGKAADIAALAPKFASIGDYLKGASTNAASQVTSGINTSQATKDAAHTAVDTKLGDLQKDLSARVTADQTQGTNVSSKYKNDLVTGNIDGIAEDLKQGNVPADQIETITSYLRSLRGGYGLAPDASQFYNSNPAADINPSTVASKEDYDNAAAYEKLTGMDSSGILDQGNIDKAGTWDTAKAGTDVNSLSDYLKNTLATQDKQTLDPANVGNLLKFDHNDPTTGARAATGYIEALKRSGVQLSPNPVDWPQPLKNTYLSARSIVNGDPNIKDTDPSGGNGRTAGLAAFVSTIERLTAQQK